MVTIVDVAKAAGVAPSTVSYVLTGKRPISPSTRLQVEQSIRQLGYRPRGRATAPRSRTNVLALLAPLHAGVNASVIMQFVSAMTLAARGHDQDLLLLTHDRGAAGLRQAESVALADALIVMDVAAADPRLPLLMTLDRPSVLVGMPDRPAGLACVDLDFAAAAGSAVNHLADLGHRSVALIGSPQTVYERGTSYARRVMQGFVTTTQARGLRARSRPCDGSTADVRACLDDLLLGDPGTTALVVHNEAALPHVLGELRRSGRRVPEDVSVVAICPEGGLPARVTTVGIPVSEMGRLAVDQVLRQLSGDTTAEVRLLAPRLVQRETTAQAPQAR